MGLVSDQGPEAGRVQHPPVGPHLGAWQPEPDSEGVAEYGVVSYFGTDLRVVLDPLSLELTLEEFLDFAMELEEDDPKSIPAVRRFIRTMLHPDDFEKWWKLVRANRQDVSAQMGFGKWVIEQVTGHPIDAASDSDSGASTTDQNSEGDFSSRVQQRLEAEGRPDLALTVLLATEGREARRAS